MVSSNRHTRRISINRKNKPQFRMQQTRITQTQLLRRRIKQIHGNSILLGKSGWIHNIYRRWIEPMKRRTMLFPNGLLQKVEDEARKRILSMRSRKSVGTMTRDIICACILISFKDIQKMSDKRLQEIINEADK